jgi:uncharacterized paraquat-inducible protein A
LHTETAVDPSDIYLSPMHDPQANCPKCGRLIAMPDVHHDGSHCAYCATCHTEVFEAGLMH